MIKIFGTKFWCFCMAAKVGEEGSDMGREERSLYGS